MRKQLLIENKDLPKKVNQLLEKVSENEDALNEFVKNPVQVILEELPTEIGYNITKANISDGNKLVFSILSNAKFRNWLIEYQKGAEIEMSKPTNSEKSIDEIFSKDKILEDLSSAIFEYGDKEIFKSILRGADNSLPNAGTYVVTDDIAVAVAAVVALLVVVSAIDVTPRTVNSNFELLINAQRIRSISDTMITKAISERKAKNL